MYNKLRLSQASMIATLGIMLSLVTLYVPILSLLSLMIPVPYAIIATLTDKKYSWMSFVMTFFVLVFTSSPIEAINICVLAVVPGIVIGSVAREHLHQEEVNKFEPIYAGTIAYIVCVIIFYSVTKFIFKIDLIEGFMEILKEALNIQLKLIEETGASLGKNIEVSGMLDLTRNMIPTFLFFQAIILSFISYYAEVFILKRIKKVNLLTPRFSEFYLPGNALIVSLMLYMFVIFLDFIGINIYTDLIMLNLQFIFSIMFTIQGASVCIYFFTRWIRQKEGKQILMYVLILSISGFMGIYLLGMLDIIIDFRKVRSYKST